MANSKGPNPQSARFKHSSLEAALHCPRCTETFDEDDLERVAVPCDPPSGVSTHCYVWVSPCCGNLAENLDVVEAERRNVA